MARDFFMVSPRVISGATAQKALRRGHHVHHVMMALLVNPHANWIGLYYLPIPIVACETALPIDKVEDAMSFLEEVGFLKYDRENSVVWVINMARDQIGATLDAGDKKIIAIRNTVKDISHSPLAAEFVEHYGVVYHLISAPKAPSGKGLEAESTEYTTTPPIQSPTPSPSDSPIPSPLVSPLPSPIGGGMVHPSGESREKRDIRIEPKGSSRSRANSPPAGDPSPPRAFAETEPPSVEPPTADPPAAKSERRPRKPAEADPTDPRVNDVRRAFADAYRRNRGMPFVTTTHAADGSAAKRILAAADSTGLTIADIEAAADRFHADSFWGGKSLQAFASHLAEFLADKPARASPARASPPSFAAAVRDEFARIEAEERAANG